MLPIHLRRIRDTKMQLLRQGITAYAETEELIRLLKNSIKKENLSVQYDYDHAGCWFVPITNQIPVKSSKKKRD
ncbi:hypothetical protein M3E13_15025 [Oceanobacillus kimchii]|uniref:Uncharacterized protein n=2 Tax=Oceanobacillus TaxID=182709 RepID=A0ABQ5TIZ0_9BACI|nr:MULTISPECIES: hypothetical protein [Oceanobacillus]MBT2650780.1 hypothetical protein [Oceanobacillus sp. ISL-73]MBT2600823.1 hypothetical protein [Oceanobacillus sp. ISL-74]MCT1575578.1 hypothetical protein [Oceanobacillus kimchii]MCT2137209.1 hypothetical protein [Oceanobacillus kimchii]OEH55391.1 hypothetical protein AQ616_04235 [Oceanobacillus sp. E9]